MAIPYLNHPMISRPVRVHWMGWESDTFKLQQAGWEVCVEELVERMQMRMVVRHREEGFIGQTDSIDYRQMVLQDPRTLDYLDMPIWQMRAARSILVSPHMDVSRFRAVDCDPYRYIPEQAMCSLEDLLPWSDAPLVRTKALILPEASVDDLLAGILERQQSAKTMHFKDMALKGELFPKHHVHAQIISLAA